MTGTRGWDWEGGGEGGGKNVSLLGQKVERSAAYVSHLLVLVFKVRVVKLAEAGEKATVELEGASVGGVVNGGSVEKDNHASKLDPAPDGPLLPEGCGDEVEDEEVGSPNGDGAEVVEDGMPHAVEHEGDEDRESVVEEDGEEVEKEHLWRMRVEGGLG